MKLWIYDGEPSKQYECSQDYFSACQLLHNCSNVSVFRVCPIRRSPSTFPKQLLDGKQSTQNFFGSVKDWTC